MRSVIPVFQMTQADDVNVTDDPFIDSVWGAHRQDGIRKDERNTDRMLDVYFAISKSLILLGDDD